MKLEETPDGGEQLSDGVEQVTEQVGSAFVDFVVAYQVPIRILCIIVGAFVLHWVLRLLLRRMIERVVTGVKKAQNVDSTQELSVAPKVSARAVQRARALGGIGRSVITWAIVIVALAMILGNLGFDLTAVLASAGVLAAALAFGAQNVVKDILNGIFMAFEDQLGVGDVVTIGEVSGTVEDVGIRITQVRSIDGTLWFVRNGEILTLGNSSQGWGRALVDITIDANSDLELAERAAIDAARELLSSPAYARKVTGEPEVWGLESVYGDRATLRMVMRTRPEAQWEVQRALRAALQAKYRELDIPLAAELPKYPGGAQ
ncbi:mechanosensitive ion channel family protein [Leucobacter sp. CSA1]|uniref:Mechanosensitive ion channel family protein n=1 Tax=Leucobacter chromiisoli TaxID=2796471 RepID=A0A934Q8H3_9MICO|nr:mechanosensitive ion channel family protein [Leucobacter chromiisoli]MBK0420179.1 mechanosensitive ion channel family protein [Leucobacter chromiisoli]